MKIGDAPQREFGPTRACWRHSEARCSKPNAPNPRQRCDLDLS